MRFSAVAATLRESYYFFFIFFRVYIYFFFLVFFFLFLSGSCDAPTQTARSANGRSRLLHARRSLAAGLHAK